MTNGTRELKLQPAAPSAVLIIRGQGGVVAAEVWAGKDGKPHGILGLHYGTEQASSPHPYPNCPYLGTCYPDQSWIAGAEIAAHWNELDAARAWELVQEWYDSRILPPRKALS